MIEVGDYCLTVDHGCGKVIKIWSGCFITVLLESVIGGGLNYPIEDLTKVEYRETKDYQYFQLGNYQTAISKWDGLNYLWKLYRLTPVYVPIEQANIYAKLTREIALEDALSRLVVWYRRG